MKQLQLLFIGCLLAVTLFSCSNKTKSTAVCVWNKVSLRAEPNEKSQWLAAINLGEKVTFLEETAQDSSGKKVIEYYKISLKDGKSGWVRADYIVLNSSPAVIINNTPIYNRPDLLTKSNKNFMPMDIVAVKTSEDESWSEVVGKRSEGKWIETGWIKPENISFQDVDLAVAIYTKAATDETDETKQLAMLQEISNNSDLSNSIFMETVYEMIHYLSGEESDEYYEEEEYADEVTEESTSDTTVYAVD